MLIRKQSANIHIRNLLSTPFAPFFVLFCHVIETSSAADLQILIEFVQSLQISRDVSEPADKLYRLCRVMGDVAMLYVEAKSQQQDLVMGEVGNEFEMYLSQLGFMPGEDQGMMSQTMMRPMAESDQMAHIADWFSGSQNMMSLLEEDFSNIGGYTFMDMPGGPSNLHLQPSDGSLM